MIATKYTLSTRPGDPNSGGNHRKNMVQSVEASLRRLNTDYIDLYYLHAWDGTTPVDEVMRAMDDLVRAGKVLYVGISDIPAWQVARMQTIADLRGWSPLVALQIEYSLIERTVERDLIPMAAELGLGVIPWSPLASGVLTGKYTRADLAHGDGFAEAIGTRKSMAAANGALSERGLDIADVVKKVAADIGTTPSQVALAWTLHNPAVTAPIIGARTPAQLADNLGALEVTDPRRRAGQPGRSQRYPARFPARFPGPADDPQQHLWRHQARDQLTARVRKDDVQTTRPIYIGASNDSHQQFSEPRDRRDAGERPGRGDPQLRRTRAAGRRGDPGARTDRNPGPCRRRRCECEPRRPNHPSRPHHPGG